MWMQWKGVTCSVVHFRRPLLEHFYRSRSLLTDRHCISKPLNISTSSTVMDDTKNGIVDWDQKLEFVKQHVNSYEDFPKKGILFRDIFSVLYHCEASATLQELITAHVSNLKQPVDAVIGLESRGFLFGPQISQTLGIPFIPIRKRGKLPGELLRKEYSLEYGTDIIEIQKASLVGKHSVLIVDDLLATGGTMKAACDLIKSCGVNIAECFVIMELTALNGKRSLSAPFYSLIRYD